MGSAPAPTRHRSMRGARRRESQGTEATCSWQQDYPSSRNAGLVALFVTRVAGAPLLASRRVASRYLVGAAPVPTRASGHLSVRAGLERIDRVDRGAAVFGSASSRLCRGRRVVRSAADLLRLE